MQAIKDKISDMSARRKAKADAKAEEKAEKEYVKARLDVVHEVRLAKEAEASMDLHVAKADRKAQRELAKHTGVTDQNPKQGGPCSGSGYECNVGSGSDPGAIGNDPNLNAYNSSSNQWL